MGTGSLIAIDVLLLYLIFGPVVLLGIYVLFDAIDPTGKDPTGKPQKDASPEKDPALWTSEDVDATGFQGMGLDGRRNKI
ncbi:hypothetical protein [Desulfobacter sp.]